MPKQPRNRAERRSHDPTLPSADHHPALDMIPRPLFVLTALFEGYRRGQLVRHVQLSSTSPPTVSVAIPKGQPISPLIRDSQAFGLCQISDDDGFLERKFAEGHLSGFDEQEADPFDSLDPIQGVTGAPLIARALTCIDCRVTMHMDFETDFELYIGEVVFSSANQPDAEPLIRIGPHT